MGPEHHNQQRAASLHYERWTKGKLLDLVGQYDKFCLLFLPLHYYTVLV